MTMTYDIYINSAIGWPFSADYVRDELAKCKKKPCNVYISSLGGAVIDALQIRQMFLEECAQPFSVIPLVKQTIEYIV